MKRFQKIPVFAINLSKSAKRKGHIQEQFKDKDEFEFKIFRGVKSKTGYIGFFKSIRKVIKLVSQTDHEFVIICSDDHVFTENYKKETFIKCIRDAAIAGAKILLGGIERYGEAIPLTDHLFWLDHFAESSFYVVFRSHFQELIQLDLNDVPCNSIISSSTSNKFLIYPFISFDGISTKKNRGMKEYSRECSEQLMLESISRLEKILYLKKHTKEINISASMNHLSALTFRQK